MTYRAPCALDLVTVVFHEELPLMNLQARSIARFFAADVVNRILVIVNDYYEEDCAAEVAAIRAAYGRFSDRLEIVRPASLRSKLRLGPWRRLERWFVSGPSGAVMRRLSWRDRLANGWRGNPGWAMQQAQKLLAANIVSGSHVLILDAKNFFIAPVGADTFMSGDGRARSRRVRLTPGRRRTWMKASFRALGMEAPAIEEGPPTVTPVVVEREVMRRAVADLEARLGPLEVFFALHKRRATEFMLLFAAVDRGSGAWWEVFAEGLPASHTAFASSTNVKLSRVLARARAGGSPVMGLHRQVISRIGKADRDEIFAFWLELGLFDSRDEARGVFPEAA